jgi:excisionase family DNA binding protein
MDTMITTLNEDISRRDSVNFHPQVGRSVSIATAVRLLGVSRRTVYYWIRDGRLQTVRTLGASQRVLTDSLEFARRRVPISH